ncbi:hypothetical protein ACWEQ4_01385 [Rhodococcus sp. NPDC003994]
MAYNVWEIDLWEGAPGTKAQNPDPTRIVYIPIPTGGWPNDSAERADILRRVEEIYGPAAAEAVDAYRIVPESDAEDPAAWRQADRIGVAS